MGPFIRTIGLASERIKSVWRTSPTTSSGSHSSRARCARIARTGPSSGASALKTREPAPERPEALMRPIAPPSGRKQQVLQGVQLRDCQLIVRSQFSVSNLTAYLQLASAASVRRRPWQFAIKADGPDCACSNFQCTVADNLNAVSDIGSALNSAFRAKMAHARFLVSDENSGLANQPGLA